MSDTRKALLNLLSRSAESWSDDLGKVNEELRDAFLSYFSETPDNVDTAKYLALGQYEEDHGAAQGLVLEGYNQPISTILWSAFGESEVPKSVAEIYPSLTQEEWNQVIRIAQIVVSLFEIPKPEQS
jgi:hypothetical protein